MLQTDITVSVDGQPIAMDIAMADPLTRAVIISLFTWARADAAEVPPGEPRQGWWGDSFADQPGDQIGSKLWLLAREKLLPETLHRARDYARQALAWLVADGVAARVEVTAERQGLDRLALGVVVARADGSTVALSFGDVWGIIRNA